MSSEIHLLEAMLHQQEDDLASANRDLRMAELALEDAEVEIYEIEDLIAATKARLAELE